MILNTFTHNKYEICWNHNGQIKIKMSGLCNLCQVEIIRYSRLVIYECFFKTKLSKKLAVKKMFNLLSISLRLLKFLPEILKKFQCFFLAYIGFASSRVHSRVSSLTRIELSDDSNFSLVFCNNYELFV